MNPKVREASGHVAGFSDPLIDCKKCKARERADKLIEEKLQEIKKKRKNISKELLETAQSLDQETHNILEDIESIFGAVEYNKSIYGAEKGIQLREQYNIEVDENLKKGEDKNALAKTILETINPKDDDETFIMKSINNMAKISISNINPEARTFEQQTAFLNWFQVKCPEC
jgi:hypothetical protein